MLRSRRRPLRREPESASAREAPRRHREPGRELRRPARRSLSHRAGNRGSPAGRLQRTGHLAARGRRGEGRRCVLVLRSRRKMREPARARERPLQIHLHDPRRDAGVVAAERQVLRRHLPGGLYRRARRGALRSVQGSLREAEPPRRPAQRRNERAASTSCGSRWRDTSTCRHSTR